MSFVSDALQRFCFQCIFPEQEGHGPAGASPEEVTELIKGMEDSAMRKGWESWDCSPWSSFGVT